MNFRNFSVSIFGTSDTIATCQRLDKNITSSKSQRNIKFKTVQSHFNVHFIINGNTYVRLSTSLTAIIIKEKSLVRKYKILLYCTEIIALIIGAITSGFNVLENNIM